MAEHRQVEIGQYSLMVAYCHVLVPTGCSKGNRGMGPQVAYKTFPVKKNINFLLSSLPYDLLCSIFSLATPEELEAALKWWRAKIDDGTADQYLKECEEERHRMGLSVSVVAYKPQ